MRHGHGADLYPKPFEAISKVTQSVLRIAQSRGLDHGFFCNQMRHGWLSRMMMDRPPIHFGALLSRTFAVLVAKPIA